MILGLSTSQLREILQQQRPIMMALLRMKLNTVNVPQCNRTRELRAVIAEGGDVFRPLAIHVVGMQEIEPCFGLQPTEQL